MVYVLILVRDLPEMYLYGLKKVEKYLGKPIIQVGESLGDIIEYEMNWFCQVEIEDTAPGMSKD